MHMLPKGDAHHCIQILGGDCNDSVSEKALLFRFYKLRIWLLTPLTTTEDFINAVGKLPDYKLSAWGYNIMTGKRKSAYD